MPSGSWWTLSQPQQFRPPLGPLELQFCLSRVLFHQSFKGSIFHFIQVGVQISSPQNMFLPLCTHLLIPVATVTNFPKRGRLRQQTLIPWQFQKSDTQNQFPRAQSTAPARPLPSGGTKGDCSPASRVAFPGCLGALLPLQRIAFRLCRGQISRCLLVIRTLTSRACSDHPGEL